jgi:2'-deoxynucleoside 5'-phosphate N-hydrolase
MQSFVHFFCFLVHLQYGIFKSNVYNNPLIIAKIVSSLKKTIMKIYFAGSIRGGREDAALYQQIIEYLKTFGEVLTEHIGNPNLTDAGDDGPTDRFIHDRDLDWLQSADVVVAEVTTVSMGVGYEIGRAVESGKKVLCLFRPDSDRNLSAMIAGCADLVLVNYQNLDEAKRAIEEFLER